MLEGFQISAFGRIDGAYRWPVGGDGGRCFVLCGLLTPPVDDFSLCLPMPEPFIGSWFSVLPAETPVIKYIVNTATAHFTELCVSVGEPIRKFVVRSRIRVRMTVRRYCAHIRKTFCLRL